MKVSAVLTATAGLIVALGMLVPAVASASPKIYEQARALPTRNGENVKIVVFTNRISAVNLSVNGDPRVKAKRMGTGCGRLRCEKWQIHAVRTGDECYEVTIFGRRGDSSASLDMTVCEPFRNGEI